jgi:hypothetical protein
MLDRDGSGGISKDEFRNGVSALNVRFDDHHVDALFKMVDADGNGEVTKEELKAGLFPHSANFIKVQGKYDSYNGYAPRVRTPLVNVGVAAGPGPSRPAVKSGNRRRRRRPAGGVGEIGRLRRVGGERGGRSKRHTYSGDGVSRRTVASSTAMRTYAGAPMVRRSGRGSGSGRGRDRDSSGALGLRGPETNDGSDGVQQMRPTARPRRLPSMESPVPQQLGHAATVSHLPRGVSGGRDAGFNSPVHVRGEEGEGGAVPRSLPSLGKRASTLGL